MGVAVKVLVFSDSRSAPKWFSAVVRSRSYQVDFLPAETIRDEVRGAEPGALVYVDIANLDGDGRRILQYLARNSRIRFGIIDPKGSIKDVAQEFFAGASDYLGPATIREGVSPRRVRAVFDFLELEGEHEMELASVGEDDVSWSTIRPGQEYPFTFMFIELDNQAALKRELGASSLSEFLRVFHDHVCAQISTFGGRQWIWNEFGGVSLFPFDGKRCDALMSCFRLVLNRRIHAADLYDFEIVPSFRIVLDIGRTEYRERGRTGKIVSDAVNSVFHIGQKFARPGNFYLTGAVETFMPSAMGDYFVPAGAFEGRELYRMKLLL
jgi:hypothetical protein